MSILDNLSDIGAGVIDWVTGNSNSAALARAAGLGYLLNQLNKSTNNDNKTEKPVTEIKTQWSREQIDPDTSNAIPILYGSGFIGGMVTDAVLSDDQQTMWYVLTICEKTGTLKSTGQDSVITFQKIYWDDCELVFKSDGITVEKQITEDNHESSDMSGLVQFYLYNNGSGTPCKLYGYGSGATQPAYSIFPNWTPEHTMDQLVFAIIKVKYNAEKNVTGLGTIQFKLSNTLKKPGDVLYDYMLNTRYGAGINADEVYYT